MSHGINTIGTLSGETEQTEDKPRKKSDELLKGAFEDNFYDFLRFVYSDADEILDFDKGIEFMDKELFAIIPDRERKRDKRVADLLAKVYLKDGTEKWVLLNVEIEGGNDAEFALRLFQYNYRIRDRYQVSVASIAVFTGNENQNRPAKYRDELLGTVLSFKYTSYHVFDDSQEVLLKKKNPFALIALACQKALLEGKIPDEELNEHRLTIVKTLLKQNYGQERIISFLLFLKNFIFIKNEDINRKFDQQIDTITEGRINMGIIETIKMQERRDGHFEGKLEGKLEGHQEGKLEGHQEGKLEERAKSMEEKRDIALELKKEGLSADAIARITKLSREEVEGL